MARDRERASFVAVRRFGLGARPGEIVALRDDPRGAVLAQLQPRAGLLASSDLPSTVEALRRYWVYIAEVKRLREAEPPKPMAAAAPNSPSTAAMSPMPAPMPASVPEQLHRGEFEARLDRQLSTTTPMVERLVNFWSNHFCVASRKGPMLRTVAGAYEREVVRPHVFGRFADMLSASAHHPAMLAYLDNNVSIGPSSKVGQRSKKGLNENLGREILELHTLGVEGGYSQADVTALSAALTGWDFAGMTAKSGEPGTFLFFPERHQPGPVRVLGKEYAQGGADQAEAIFEDLARHPATARHVARKLVRHFVGDQEPAGLVARLTRVFLDTDGDLRAVSSALVGSDEAWRAPPAKVLPPWDFLVATGRMLGIDWRFGEANRMLSLFGQPLWNVPFPSGWPDDDDAWAAPASLLELLDAVAALARRNAGDRNVPRLADETIGAFLHPETRRTIERAETPEIALTLLLMSPDFLRR